MNGEAPPNTSSADGWGQFVAWVTSDPGEVATFFGVGLTFIVAALSTWVGWRAYRSTRAHGERDQGWVRYTTAIGYMNSIPRNPDLAMEGVRILQNLLRSTWPAKLDREMAEESLAEFEQRLSGGER